MRRMIGAGLVLGAACLLGPGAAAETVRPMPEDSCKAIGQLVATDLGVQPSISVVSVKRPPDIAGRACRVKWTGSGLDREDQVHVVDQFFANYLDWQPDFMVFRDGPGLEVQAFRKEQQLIVMSARWTVPNSPCKPDDASAACKIPPKQRVWTIEVDGMTTQP
ncbi:MAG: hypothetical protein ABWY78_01890 [Microvirga sp.]